LDNYCPIVVAIIGFGFVKYMQQQSKAERPVIAVVADNNIKKVLTSKKSTAWGCI
jgi:ABC-2 type transport system permease protein